MAISFLSIVVTRSFIKPSNAHAKAVDVQSVSISYFSIYLINLLWNNFSKTLEIEVIEKQAYNW